MPQNRIAKPIDMKRILVPSDFSATAVEAFKFALSLAGKAQGEVHVLHVIDTVALPGSAGLSYSYSFHPGTVKELERKANTYFNAMRDAYATPGITIHFRYKLDSLVTGIQRYVREEKIDLIVMGTQGHGQHGVGSNTGRIVRHAPVPVLTVRKEPTEPVRNIVVPVSRPGEARFFEQLVAMQQFFGASLHLVWINTPRTFRNDRDVKADLEKFAETGKLTNCTIHVRADFSPEHGIYAFAKEINADLIAMGTHAWKGFMYLLAGSIAEDIVNHVDFPIWTAALGDA